VTVDHLLEGRLRDLAEEHHRERPLRPLRGRTSRRSCAGTSAGNTP
jgi:hypothetical protein